MFKTPFLFSDLLKYQFPKLRYHHNVFIDRIKKKKKNVKSFHHHLFLFCLVCQPLLFLSEDASIKSDFHEY